MGADAGAAELPVDRAAIGLTGLPPGLAGDQKAKPDWNCSGSAQHVPYCVTALLRAANLTSVHLVFGGIGADF